MSDSRKGPRVTAVVVTHNSADCVEACLRSLMAEQAASVEVAVVDNASTDGTAERLRAGGLPLTLVANRDNRGFAAAANQGAALGQGDYVLLLNPDAALMPGALESLVAFLEGHPQAGAAGPRQYLDAPGGWQWSIVPAPPDWRPLLAARAPALAERGQTAGRLAAAWSLNRRIWREDAPQSVPHLSGAGLLVRRVAWEAVGGLDEGFFLFYEDLDLCDRLRAAGWALYAVPQAAMVHHGLHSVRHSPGSGQPHLAQSGQRYLARHSDPLTRTLWALVQARRMRRTRRKQPPPQTVDGGEQAAEVVLTWPVAPGATGYWVELARDRTFLYTAAAQVVSPPCTLPPDLAAIAGGGFAWRVAPVDAEGQLGLFAEPRAGRDLEEWTL